MTAPQTSTKAIVALVLSLVSWFVVPLIPAIVALVLARQATEEIAASNGMLTGSSLNSAARVLAWINIALSCFVFGVIALAVLIPVLLGGAG